MKAYQTTKWIAGIVAMAGLPIAALAVADVPANTGDDNNHVVVLTTTADTNDPSVQQVEVKVVAVTDDDIDAADGTPIFVSADVNSNGEHNVQIIRRSARAVDENRGWLGIALTDVKTSTAQEKDVPEGSVMVLNVVKDSPADIAGLKEGDIITDVNGEAVTGVPQFGKSIAELGPGAQARMNIVRDGQDVTITAPSINRRE